MTVRSEPLQESADPPTDDRRSRARALRSGARFGGTLLIIVGVLALTWVFVVWRWGDPVTAFYAGLEQRELRKEYSRKTADLQTPRPAAQVKPSAPRRTLASVLTEVSRDAKAYRKTLSVGDPVGLLDVPRMRSGMVVVDGTDHDSLKRGPGLDLRTAVPGQGRLTYIAGHRTTYGAPFAHIERLRRGDPILFSLPYAKFHYVVTGHRIVPADKLSVLRSRGREQLALQACHPRFFATERYIADARLARIEVPGAAGGWETYSIPQ